ncbi:MAG: hypothetical protein OJF55_001919 [Rhodanobacteraceae bacterium]|nr:MAG: hypothetical protein OJF55_001919 [Rhodanobacteraceae bacterium]
MKRRLPRSRQRQQGGFILLTVLAMLVVLVLLASAAATTADRVRADQQLDDARLAGQLDARSTEATLLYLLATQRRTFAGLTVDARIVYTPSELAEKAHGEFVTTLMPVGNELRMNDEVYSGLGSSRFALMTDAGRANISMNPVLRQNWLIQLKTSPQEQSRLSDTLLDYQSPGNFPRLNGAKADQYREKGLQPPPERTLFTPLELRRVMDWGKLLAPMDDATLLNTLTTVRPNPIDVNAAPLSVLMMLPGVTRTMAERVVALRNVQAFVDNASVYTLLPTLDEESDSIGLYPSDSGTMALWPDATGAGTLVHWTLTPFDNGGSPWHIDYELRLPARAGGNDAPPHQPQTPLLGDTQAAHPGQSDATPGSGASD